MPGVARSKGRRVAPMHLRSDQLQQLILFFDVHAKNSHVPIGFRRSSGSAANVFYLESFIDELAHAAGRDSYEYRRELIARNTKFPNREDWLKALDLVAEMSDWGKPLPQGWARGIAIDDHRHTGKRAVAICAHVVTVSHSRIPPKGTEGISL